MTGLSGSPHSDSTLRSGGAREQVIHFTNSKGTCPNSAGRIDTTTGQMPLHGELWTNKKVTEFSASIMTLAAFQSGHTTDGWQQIRAANMPARVERVCKRIQLCQKSPFGRKTYFNHLNNVTRLFPTVSPQLL